MSLVHMICTKVSYLGGFSSYLMLEVHEVDKIRYNMNEKYVVIILTTADALWGLFGQKVKSLPMIGKVGGK